MDKERISRREAIKAVTIIVGSALGISALAGCVTSKEDATRDQRKILEEAGMSGEHPMIDGRSIPGFSQTGDISGGFLSFSGKLEGETTTILKFGWKVNAETKVFQVSEVSFKRIQFLEADPEAVPTVKFEMDENSLRKLLLSRSDINSWYARRTDNLNEYVAASNLVIISLSKEDYKNFSSIQK